MYKLRNTQKWVKLVVVLTAPLLYVIDIFIINMAIPGIKAGVHATNGEVQLVIAAYLLGGAPFLIISGRLGDYFGRKKIFFWGMFLFTLTSCLCGLAQSPLQLNITRFFQGMSASLMVPQSIALIQVMYTDPKERATAIGWYGVTLSIAAIIGQILGGYLVDTHFGIAGWRLIFLINLPIGVISLWAIKQFLKETKKDSSQQFDYSGSVVLTAGLICLIYPLTQGREAGWPLWSIFLLLVCPVFFVWFFRMQKKRSLYQQTPLIDMALFDIKSFKIGLLAVLFHFMMHTAFLLISAIYLQSGLGLSALVCGLYFVLHALLFMLSSLIASKLILRFGKLVLQAGLIIILLSFVMQIMLYNDQTNALTINLLIGLYGLGNGLVLPFLLTIVLKSIPDNFAGAAAGVFSTVQQTASALGICILGGVFYYVLDMDKVQANYLRAFQWSLAGGIVCLPIVAFMLHLLPRQIDVIDR